VRQSAGRIGRSGLVDGLVVQPRGRADGGWRTQAPTRRAAHTWPRAPAIRCGAPPSNEDRIMSKGMDRKKETKKKPAKTMKEKRAEKNEKKTTKGFAPV